MTYLLEYLVYRQEISVEKLIDLDQKKKPIIKFTEFKKYKK